MEAGRLPSILGQEFFRNQVTSYHVSSFEDVVIFVHDVERCIDRLNPVSKDLIGRIALQGYSQDEAARLIGCSRRTVGRRFPEALDELSEIFLRVGILTAIADPPQHDPEACQEGEEGETTVNYVKAKAKKFSETWHIYPAQTGILNLDSKNKSFSPARRILSAPFLFGERASSRELRGEHTSLRRGVRREERGEDPALEQQLQERIGSEGQAVSYDESDEEEDDSKKKSSAKAKKAPVADFREVRRQVKNAICDEASEIAKEVAEEVKSKKQVSSMKTLFEVIGLFSGEPGGTGSGRR
jgi:hypothetical protein